MNTATPEALSVSVRGAPLSTVSVTVPSGMKAPDSCDTVTVIVPSWP